MDPFASIADLALFLNVAIPNNDPRAALCVQLATGAVQAYTDQLIGLVDDEVIELPGSGGENIFLPELPVIDIDSLSVGGAVLVPEDPANADPNGDYWVYPNGVLRRVGQPWDLEEHVSVTYTHGFAVIPDAIRLATLKIAGRLYGSPGVQGLISAETMGSYSYQVDAAAAIELLEDEKNLLASYCRIAV